MSLPIPDLDDRSFDDLIKEAISLIPIYNKEWTNHNPSDPGITLLELFAWLTEMVIYRANQIPEENYKRFLKMIGIELGEGESIDSGIRRGLAFLSQRYRAITSYDYQSLAMESMNILKDGLGGRAICVNNKDLEYSMSDKPGHVSVIIIPECEGDSEYCTADGMPTANLLKEVKEFLDIRRLITTRVHVVAPNYHKVKIKVWAAIKENRDKKKVLAEAKKRIEEYFHPITGGTDRSGWPLGRDIYRSELYHLLEGTTSIDHVVRLSINDDPIITSIEIEEDHLITLDPEPTIEEAFNE
ncbi:MAG: baseplate J/gp47 family protein [Nitrospirota bacterium]